MGRQSKQLSSHHQPLPPLQLRATGTWNESSLTWEEHRAPQRWVTSAGSFTTSLSESLDQLAWALGSTWAESGLGEHRDS